MKGGWLLQLCQCRDFPSILLQLPHRAPDMGEDGFRRFQLILPLPSLHLFR